MPNNVVSSRLPDEAVQLKHVSSVLGVHVSELFHTWRCVCCKHLYIDGDYHQPEEAAGSGFAVEITERWLGDGPVCEDCGLIRNIPKYV